MVFLKEYFEKADFEKKSADDKKSCKITLIKDHLVHVFCVAASVFYHIFICFAAV